MILLVFNARICAKSAKICDPYLSPIRTDPARANSERLLTDDNRWRAISRGARRRAAIAELPDIVAAKAVHREPIDSDRARIRALARAYSRCTHLGSG